MSSTMRVRTKQPATAKDSSDHNASKRLPTLPNDERDVQSSHARRARLEPIGGDGMADNSSKHKPKQVQKTKSDLAYISNHPYAGHYKYDHFQISVPPPHHRSDSSSTAASSGSSGSSSPPTEPPDNVTTPRVGIDEEARRMDDAVEREDSPALEGDGGFPTGEGYPGTVRWVYCYD